MAPAWLEMARNARQQLADTQEWGRERKLQAIAGNKEVNSVRRLLLALGVFDRWTAAGKVAPDRLLAAPQTVVEVLARWDEFEPDGAWKAFLQWENEGTTVQAMNAALRQKREAKGIVAGRSVESGYRKTVEPEILDIVRELILPEFHVIELRRGERTSGMPPVDFDCLAVNNGKDFQAFKVAILIVGPYRSAALYSRKMSEWMQKALSVAWLYPTVVVVVPDGKQAHEYQRWMANFQRKIRTEKLERRPVVHVVGGPRSSGNPDVSDESGENPNH